MWVRQSEMSDFIQAVKTMRKLVPVAWNHADFRESITSLDNGQALELYQSINRVVLFSELIGGKEMEILQEIGK